MLAGRDGRNHAVRMRWLLLGLAAAGACGGQLGGGADGGDAGPTPTTPDAWPSPPAVNLCGTGSTCRGVFVMKTPYLGDKDRGGTTPSTTAWKNFGENIDGRVSDSKSTDVCTRAAGAPSSVQVDGTAGIDNSFGANTVPILQSVGSVPSPSDVWTQHIAQGDAHTLLFEIDVRNGAVTAHLHLAAPLGKPAAFDGSDAWPVSGLASEGGVSQIDYPSPTVQQDGTIVSGRATQRGLVSTYFNGTSWAMPIDRLQFRLTVAPGMKSASGGMLSGVAPVEPFVDSLRQIAGGISKSLCGSAFDGIAQQLRQTVDILPDGTNAPGVACAAISFGMGFDVAPAGLGSLVGEAIVSPC